MRTLIWAGWLMIALGAAMLAGSIAAGALAFGLLMLASLAAPGVLMVWLATGWDKPLARTELQRFGRPANATVRKVEDAKLDGNGTRTAKLSLHVTPRNESAYKARRRVVLPDFVGFGLSDKPDRRYGIHLSADTIEGAVAELGLEHVDLLTHDMGDSVGGSV